jgi:thiol-disulfide isomerase/thioredoxin
MSTNNALSIALAALVLVMGGTAEDLRKSAPAFPVLAKYKGKVVLLNFWETTCGGCKLEIPWLIEFEKQFKASGFTVLGVALDEAG